MKYRVIDIEYHRNRLHRELKILADQYNYSPIWGGNGIYFKYFIAYDHEKRKVFVDEACTVQQSPFIVYFKTKRAAKLAIKQFTDEEWRMYFGVES